METQLCVIPKGSNAVVVCSRLGKALLNSKLCNSNSENLKGWKNHISVSWRQPKASINVLASWSHTVTASFCNWYGFVGGWIVMPPLPGMGKIQHSCSIHSNLRITKPNYITVHSRPVRVISTRFHLIYFLDVWHIYHLHFLWKKTAAWLQSNTLFTATRVRMDLKITIVPKGHLEVQTK